MKEEISLSLETSGRIGSVAIGRNGELIEEKIFSGPLCHGAETLATTDRLFQSNGLRPQDLEIIYVSAGPGSFTGIRLAVTMAKTMAYAVNARIVAVPSLEAMALNADIARQDGIVIDNVAAVLEAGRGKVFAAVFQHSPGCHKSFPGKSYIPNYLTILPPDMITPEELIEQLPADCVLMGEGLRYHQESFGKGEHVMLDEQYHQTRARHVMQCGILRRESGMFTDFATFTPYYMRKPEAELNMENINRN